MKKFIKKTLAGLIAGVMAVSSMPFAAMADDTTALDEAKTALNNFVYTNPTGKYGSLNGDNTSNFASGTDYTTYMRNVLYGEESSNDDQGNTSVGSESNYQIVANIRYPQMVMLYDGENDLDVPVLARLKSTGTWNKGKPRYTYAGENTNSNLKLVNDTVWYGSSQDDNWVDLYSNSKSNDIGQLGANINAGKIVRISKDGVGGWWNNTYRWANMFRFNGSFATDEYTKSVTPSVTFYTGSKETVSTTDLVNNCNATKPLYYINYKAVLDKINTAKSDITSVSYDKYTEDSVNAYANAVKALTSFNPATDLTFSASSLENDVSNAGTKIKTLIDNYKSAYDGLQEVVKYTYTFVKADGTRTTVEAENDAKALESKPANTASTQKTYAGNNQHKWVEYSWPAKATNYEFVETSAEKTEACNIVNDVCTGCSVDYSALNSAITNAKAIYDAGNADNIYTDDSYSVFKTAYENATSVKENGASNIEEINSVTTALVSAQNNLVRAAFTVTVETYENANLVNTNVLDPKQYGDKATAVRYAGENGEYEKRAVEKWVVLTDNLQTSTKLNSFDTSVDIVVTKDVVVQAYLSDEDVTSPDKATSKVTFYGKNNQVVAVKYVEEGNTLDLTSDEMKKLAPAIPFYDFNGWDVASVTGDGNDYSVKAVYECTQAEDEMCGVHYAGFENGVKKYSYDSYVYLTGANKSKKYALYSDEACTQLLTVLDGIDFYAPKTKDIYVGEYTGSNDDAHIGVTGSFIDTENYAFVYNCKFDLPEDATAVEWGFEVTEINGAAKKLVIKAEKKSDRNEYSIRLSAPTSITKVKGKAFVTYRLADGTTETAESTEVELG